MSPELSRDPSQEEVDVVELIRRAIFAELDSRKITVSSLSRLSEQGEVLDEIMPSVQQRIVNQGHDFDSLNLIEALLDDEGETDTSLPDQPPDIDPDDNRTGGSKVPRIPIRPIVSGSGAVEEPIERDQEDLGTRESLFPQTDPIDPLRRGPRVPVSLD